MDLLSIAQAFPDVSVTVRLGDLLEANKRLARDVRKEGEREQAKRRKEYGDALVPKEEARHLLGDPDPTTLWRWENAGILDKVKIGTKVFYRRSDLNKIINTKTTHA